MARKDTPTAGILRIGSHDMPLARRGDSPEVAVYATQYALAVDQVNTARSRPIVGERPEVDNIRIFIIFNFPMISYRANEILRYYSVEV